MGEAEEHALPDDVMLHLEPPLTTSLTAAEFEKYVYRLVKLLGRDLRDLKVELLEKIEGYDGEYTFDVTARFRGFGELQFLTLFECKKYKDKNPVERAEVQELYAKMHSVGAQKAVMVSTSGYQSGAVRYAKTHGIATVQVVDQALRYLTNSAKGALLVPYPLVRGRYATWLHRDEEDGIKIDVAELHPDLIRQVLGLSLPGGSIVHEGDACKGCGEVAYLVGRRPFRVTLKDGVIPIPDENQESEG